MNNHEIFWGIFGVIIIACASIISSSLGQLKATNEVRLELIEKGFAEYHNTTGNWQYKPDSLICKGYHEQSN